MKSKFLLPMIALLSVADAGAAEISSPSGRVTVTTGVTEVGAPYYSVSLDGHRMIVNSPLGIVTDFADLSTGLSESNIHSERDRRTYTQDRIKRSRVEVDATRATVTYRSDDGRRLEMDWHVADDGVAFRYKVPRQGGRASMRVVEEKTGFNFPDSTRAFLTSQCDPMTGWKRSKPSYEEYYAVDVPVGTDSQYGHGYTFPALFHLQGDRWALVSETGVDGYYCASRLSDYADGGYTVAYPMEGENNSNGTVAPALAVPGTTPWRLIALGDSPAPIVETTLPWDLVEPLYSIDTPARHGKGTWSWILWQDASINYADQLKFIDLAADMGYDNVLVDAGWDRNIGEEKMLDLFDYARAKGVKPILWFSSSGCWNDIEQSPVNRMDRPIVRKQWMKWMQTNGVDAIKVDFFGGDKQETIRLYEDILSDAADHGIEVIFHGCTLPRGWERMYPNFVGAEAVLASENLVFSQEFCDKEALHATLHPFIRNAVASMEYGGTVLNHRLNRGNNGGSRRVTTDAFQLALAVLFQNPVQNFALAPNNLLDAPRQAIEFMREVPTVWDDTRFIEGYPGRYVVLARRNGDKWYISGVSNLESPVTLDLDLSLYADSGPLTLISDSTLSLDERPVVEPDSRGHFKVTLEPRSGFVISHR
ncbi:MAG: glycoside hydrolase family 97 protein [Bacteroides sp.]|nr:glycoside hydrolase family 97 protein [Bacteroides sp.]